MNKDTEKPQEEKKAVDSSVTKTDDVVEEEILHFHEADHAIDYYCDI